MIGNYEIVIVLTVLCFGLPILYFIRKRKALNPFSILKLTKSFNYALILHIVLAGFFYGLMGYMDTKIYKDGESTDFTDILIETGMTYIIIGAFCYIPGLILLNVLSFFFSRFKTKEVK